VGQHGIGASILCRDRGGRGPSHPENIAHSRAEVGRGAGCSPGRGGRGLSSSRCRTPAKGTMAERAAPRARNAACNLERSLRSLDVPRTPESRRISELSSANVRSERARVNLPRRRAGGEVALMPHAGRRAAAQKLARGAKRCGSSAPSTCTSACG
jgi:hypothetical protein